MDIGAAYLPQNQDPTLGTSHVLPGQTAYTTNLLRPYRGIAGIEQNLTEFWDTYHSLQINVNRRFRNGFSFGANYTYGISLKGNTGLQQRYQHAADGTISLRADEAAVREAQRDAGSAAALPEGQRHLEHPGHSKDGNACSAQLTRDWQLSGVATVASGAAYGLGYSYTEQWQPM